MSDSEPSQYDSGKNTQRRNLPSWMSAREAKNKSQAENSKNEKGEKGDKQPTGGHTKNSSGRRSSKEPEHVTESAASSSSATDLSKLMNGVVFVLSGFVNPERSTLRSQALAMGASYRPDWSSDCTLLICAFANTPKFRQVQSDCGTIVSKDWISECYTQKKLVDIDQYMMHAGKPWRKTNCSRGICQDKEGPLPKSESKPTASLSSKSRGSPSPAKERITSSEVKKWAANDLTRTISWLESQEEKPEQSQIRYVAAEGILACLQDAIDSLEQNQGIGSIAEQWNSVPRVVEELIKMETLDDKSASVSRDDIRSKAKSWKRIYEEELKKHESFNSFAGNKRPKNMEGGANSRRMEGRSMEASGYDSDETVVMTEEEIELAFSNISSK